jgi:peptidase S41-like protein
MGRLTRGAIYVVLFSLASAVHSLAASSPSPAASFPAAAPSPIGSNSPRVDVPVSTAQLVNGLSAADLQAAFGLIKSNFAQPDVITDTELNRATFQGLMARLGHGLMVVPDKAALPAPPATPFYGEILDEHIGYVRPGSLQNASLQLLDKKLVEFSSKKIDGLILDLRSSSTDDFAMAAEFAKRFCGHGKTLFTLQKAGKTQKSFVSDRDPAFQGLTLVLIDEETTGGAEAVASAIRSLNKVLTIGATTAGGAVEYADLTLPSGKILRVATAEIAGADGQSLYPNGVKPDLPVELATADKRQIFQMSLDRGMGPFVHDVERPHFNEAALLSGTNPELESAEQRRTRSVDRVPRDAVVQRALDVITSLEVYQKR